MPSEFVRWPRLESLFSGVSWIRVELLPKVGGSPVSLKLVMVLVRGDICCARCYSIAQIAFCRYWMRSSYFLFPSRSKYSISYCAHAAW